MVALRGLLEADEVACAVARLLALLPVTPTGHVSEQARLKRLLNEWTARTLGNRELSRAQEKSWLGPEE